MSADAHARPAAKSSGTPRGKGEKRKRRRRVRRTPVPGSPRGRQARFAAFVVLGLALAAALSYVLMVFPREAGPSTGKAVELTFDEDEAVSSITDKLDAAGLLRSRRTFETYARIVGIRISPGQHLLTDEASAQEIVARLERLGSATKAKVTIPEGFTRFDIAKRLEALHVTTASAFLAATTSPDLLREVSIDGDSVEGHLFPATYSLPMDSDPSDVVRRLESEFERRWTQLEQNHRLGRAQLEGTLHFTRREIVTLASMVEKEAAVDEERPIIASVFINRLRDASFKRKVLQCDPTSAYGCLVLGERAPGCAGFHGKVTHAMNVDPLNTYSTYSHEGLPPGPIANPGAKSLQAVLAPATTKYLYFVTREDRRHAFSETLEEHNAAVDDLKRRTQKDHGSQTRGEE